MKKTCAFALSLFCTLATCAQSPSRQGVSPLLPEDKIAVAAVIQHFDEAWAARDMAAFGAMLTDDCDWVNIVGMHWHGRAEVTEMHRVLLAGRYKGVNLHTLSHEESAVAPGVALAMVKSRLDDFTTPDGHVVQGLETMGLMVLVKVDGKWLIRAAENSSIDPRASMKPAAK